ncbi:phosphopantetheine-binding protein [Amycolatopsis silviterrae]|uniref:Phosphopantetheine-binding protein n=1 Tax=Amycolatopsis silviterrae TaxID=1656914 RepID=A0ABW5H3X2_9PSEU
MSKARELVRSCLGPDDFLDEVTDTEDLREAGLNSGEFVLISLRLEEEIDRALTDEELGRIRSIQDIDAVLAEAA